MKKLEIKQMEVIEGGDAPTCLAIFMNSNYAWSNYAWNPTYANWIIWEISSSAVFAACG